MSKTAAIWRAERGKRSGWRARIQTSEVCGSKNHSQWTHESVLSSGLPAGSTPESARWRRMFGSSPRPIAMSARIG